VVRFHGGPLPRFVFAIRLSNACRRRHAVCMHGLSNNWAVPLDFIDLGFEHSYRVEVNPEYPSTGPWPFPNFEFGAKGRDTVTVKVSPHSRGPWVASFALENRGVIAGIYSCPNPSHVLVATGQDAYLLDANDASLAELLPIHPVTVIARPTETDLVLIGSHTDAAVLDASGLRWVTDRLFLDDFELLESPPGTIRVKGRVAYAAVETSSFALDPATGHVLSGNQGQD
jgi:hypothetical protein